MWVHGPFGFFSVDCSSCSYLRAISNMIRTGNVSTMTVVMMRMTMTTVIMALMLVLSMMLMLSRARNSDDDDGDEEQSEVDGNVDYDQKKRFEYDHQHHIMSMVLPDHVPSIAEARFIRFSERPYCPAASQLCK